MALYDTVCNNVNNISFLLHAAAYLVQRSRMNEEGGIKVQCGMILVERYVLNMGLLGCVKLISVLSFGISE